jgi:hypothetical protein
MPRGLTSGEDIIKAIEACKAELAALKNRKLQIQVRLAEIKTAIRGKWLPRGQYDQLCEEQVSLIAEIAEKEQAAYELTTRRGKLEADIRGIEKPDRLAETNLILRAVLKELRLLNSRLPPPVAG